MTIWIVVGVVVALIVILMVRANARMIKIAEPTVGFLNLIGDDATEFLQEDREAVRESFHTVLESEDAAPTCDVLLIYANVQQDGSLVGTTSSLREIVSQSGAKIVFLATGNPADYYTAALKSGEGKANIVLTLERGGQKFSHFIQRLFESMGKGMSMPAAWVRLAPQRPGDPHDDCPGTLFLCELGHMTFKR